MADRDDQTVSTRGKGEITVQHFGQATSKISSLFSAYPLRLIAPRRALSNHAVLVFILTYGGGLVAGDETNLRVLMEEHARVGLLTQGSTKIYKSPSSSICTTQTLTATIRNGAALLLLPDPVQPFAASVYRQRQIFEMDHTRSSLLLLDWVCEGRTARGESWSFTSWQGRNEIWSLPQSGNDVASTEKRLLLRDNIKMDRSTAVAADQFDERVEGMGVFGILIIGGPIFERLGDSFLQKYASRLRIGEKIWSRTPGPDDDEETKVSPPKKASLAPNPTWTATSIRDFTIVRFHAKAVESARQWLREMLTEDGTVEREFGQQYLFCLQDR